MPATIVIRNGLVLSPAAGKNAAIEKQLDLRIEDGKIVELGEALKTENHDTELDASGLIVAPGFVDLHTHLRDLGQADREDIGTGTQAAAAGGYTTVVAMANTDPPVDNTFVLGRINQLIAERAIIEVLPVATVTK
ncbi:MAG TPA: amidohydrolase family protein, partial [Chroococcales cyanobacterium]